MELIPVSRIDTCSMHALCSQILHNRATAWSFPLPFFQQRLILSLYFS